MYKRFLPLIFLCQTVLISQAQDMCAPKQIRLHFDVNKTIIAMDAVQGKGLQETIDGILAEFTFAEWDGQNNQSYYAYITNQLAAQNPGLSRASEEFKAQRSCLLKEFGGFLKQYPDLLVQYAQGKAQMLAILEQEELVIFPSFFKTIAWLDQHYPNQYAIYLRTFGQDLPQVVPAIEKASMLKFSGYGKFEGCVLSLIGSQGDLYQFFSGHNARLAVKNN